MELIRLDNGQILGTDRVASNGIIHIIDDVILREQCKFRFNFLFHC